MRVKNQGNEVRTVQVDYDSDLALAMTTLLILHAPLGSGDVSAAQSIVSAFKQPERLSDTCTTAPQVVAP